VSEKKVLLFSPPKGSATPTKEGELIQFVKPIPQALLEVRRENKNPAHPRCAGFARALTPQGSAP